MMSIMARIIDLIATLIQMPHIIICGFIAGIVREVSNGNRSMAVYAWYPATGIYKAYVDSDGYIKGRVIPYKELFN